MGPGRGPRDARGAALRRRRLTEAYRIGFAPDPSVDGQAYGSTLAAGRWHSLRGGLRPRKVIYAAASRALAQLEKRVHANRRQPVDQALYRVTLPADVVVARAGDIGLPAGWRGDAAATQAFGDAWLDAGRELALWVPSYVEPLEFNLVINAGHARAHELHFAVEREPFVFDPRLV